jgi:hypothetical protein
MSGKITVTHITERHFLPSSTALQHTYTVASTFFIDTFDSQVTSVLPGERAHEGARVFVTVGVPSHMTVCNGINPRQR